MHIKAVIRHIELPSREVHTCIFDSTEAFTINLSLINNCYDRYHNILVFFLSGDTSYTII